MPQTITFPSQKGKIMGNLHFFFFLLKSQSLFPCSLAWILEYEMPEMLSVNMDQVIEFKAVNQTATPAH